MYSYKPLEARLHAIGLNKSSLSTNLGISSRTIAKISKGEKIATNVLKKISDFLGCRIEDLFTEILDNQKQSPEMATVKTRIKTYLRRILKK